jgi:hypothetical protein
VRIYTISWGHSSGLGAYLIPLFLVAHGRFAGNPISVDHFKPAYRKPWTWPDVG